MDFSQGLLDRIKAQHNAFLKAAVCRCSSKIGLLINFVKFTEKQLCRSFFVIKLQILSLPLY